MKKVLVKQGFDKKDIVSFGNMFLIANGRFGYRGTLEEYGPDEMVAFNVLGFYDRYKDKWRESINLVNPLSFIVSFNEQKQTVLDQEVIQHQVELNIYDATFSRFSEFNDVQISSERFLSSNNKDLLVHRYIVKAKNSGTIRVDFKVDVDVHEINGTHYMKKDLKLVGDTFVFEGKTNENKQISLCTKYVSEDEIRISGNTCFIEKSVQKGDEICIFTYSIVDKEGVGRISELNHLANLGYDKLREEHIYSFNKKWDVSRVVISDEEAQFELDYSIYHLLILEDIESCQSIPARGLSGQTYKGAIFWDTETFMLPFFTLTSPSFARNLIKYRINTLPGAKKKAKGFGYEGAFFAWESQDDGVEQCSQFNVTDPITNEPIRTYFDEKQIHISGDIALGIFRYVSISGDETILREGGYEVIHECARFYISRATLRNGLYHFDDVIGPDEYHERINDNAFTNYLAYMTIQLAINYYDYSRYMNNPISLKELTEFKDMIYLPEPNGDGVIEQFDGYFKLKDTPPNEIKAMARNEKEYLGGLAKDTKTIKQADVIALIVLMNEFGLKQFERQNYDYYLPFTEHGSSLSSSMYSIAASEIGEQEKAYQLFRKSSGIDLGTDQKMYAGGIYIGGTHPASNAGAYLSVILGFAGLTFDEGGPRLNPHLPSHINRLNFRFYYKNKLYAATIEGGSHKLEEVKDHD